MAKISLILEIAGFVLLALGGLLAVVSTTTTYWRTQKTEQKDPTSYYDGILRTSIHAGLFKGCSTANNEETKNGVKKTTYGLEKCMSTVSSNAMSSLVDGNYDTVRAMMILAVISVSSSILLSLVFKNEGKDPSIPIVVLGVTAAIFCIAAVAVYKKFLLYQIPKNGKPTKGWEKSKFGPKLGWSFYLACITPVLLLVSSVLHAVNWKFCSKSNENPRSERHLMKTRS